MTKDRRPGGNDTETAERRHTMTLARFNGIWYANGKPHKDLHSAVEALRS